MSHERGASRTALMVAGYRARATQASERLCSDPWAGPLAGEAGAALAQQCDAAQPHMGLWVAVRTAFFDEAILRLAPSVAQVVILGAGLDSRAARLARPGLRFFEVDTPASQRDKRARVERAAGYPIDAATYVGCDFESQDFLEALTTAGFDTSQPAVFLWEGVTYYLSEPAVRGTLRRIAQGCHPRTTVLFDSVGRKMAEGRVRDTDDQQMLALVGGMGEPFRWGTNDLLPLLYEEGFRRVRVTTFDEACLNLTGTYARERKFRFQFLVETSRESPEGLRPGRIEE